MALNKPKFQTDVKNLLDVMFSKTDNPDQARKFFADELVNLIDGYIKSATITLPIATVNVTGTAAAQTNPAPIVSAIIS